MDVKKIVVDKLPENCSECIISCESMYSTKYYCHALHNFFERWEKPKECPLEVEEECVWKGKHRMIGKPSEYIEYKSPHELPYYHTDFPNTVEGGYFETIIFKYCHVCGKRIRYVESEE